MAKIALNPGMTSLQALYALLQSSSGLELTDKDVTASSPVADASVAGANTKITLTPVAGSELVLEGVPIDRFYSRIDIAVVASEKLTPEDLEFVGALVNWNSADALVRNTTAAEWLNGLAGTVLTADELTVGNITVDDAVTPNVMLAELTVNDGHYGLFGTINIQVTDVAPPKPELEDVLPEQTLNGFEGTETGE